MGLEENNESKVILTPPLSLEYGPEIQYRAPNLLQSILSLFKNVRPGSDLTSFQLPPLFNLPKSHLQCFGESVYCGNDNMLRRCTNANSPLDRFTAVVAWSISTIRPVIFGLAPLNPVLGETHHVSSGTLNVLLEQVSHHPPVTALHATDEEENVEMIWCQHTVPKFHGTSVEAMVNGKRLLKLLNHGENYVMNSPNLLIRLFPISGIEWVGNVTIRCEETGLEAELCYRGQSFLRFGGHFRSIKGRIFNFSTLETLFEIDGHWDRTVTLKDVNNGKISTVIYNAKDTISSLKTPAIKDPKGLWTSESTMVWSEVMQGILSKDWEKAREAKRAIEEKERELRRERRSSGETFEPKHFTVSYTKERDWECSPNNKWVPPAPIVVPH